MTFFPQIYSFHWNTNKTLFTTRDHQQRPNPNWNVPEKKNIVLLPINYSLACRTVISCMIYTHYVSRQHTASHMHKFPIDIMVKCMARKMTWHKWLLYHHYAHYDCNWIEREQQRRRPRDDVEISHMARSGGGGAHMTLKSTNPQLKTTCGLPPYAMHKPKHTEAVQHKIITIMTIWSWPRISIAIVILCDYYHARVPNRELGITLAVVTHISQSVFVLFLGAIWLNSCMQKIVIHNTSLCFVWLERVKPKSQRTNAPNIECFLVVQPVCAFISAVNLIDFDHVCVCVWFCCCSCLIFVHKMQESNNYY